MTLAKRLPRLALSIACAALLAAPFLFMREQLERCAAAGYAGLFLAALLSNGTVLLPASSTLFMLLAAQTLDPWLCVGAASLGTALGECVSYALGRFNSPGASDGGQAAAARPIRSALLRLLSRHDGLAVFLAAFLPLPLFDLVGMAAGLRRMKLWKFLPAAWLGKTLKFALTMALFELPVIRDHPLLGWIYSMR